MGTRNRDTKEVQHRSKEQAMTERLVELEQRVQHLVNQNNMLRLANQQMKRIQQAVYASEGGWIYTKDDTATSLASLTCPVVADAATFRTMLKQLEELPQAWTLEDTHDHPSGRLVKTPAPMPPCRLYVLGERPEREVVWMDVETVSRLSGEDGRCDGFTYHGATQHDEFDWRFEDDVFHSRLAAETARSRLINGEKIQQVEE